VGGACVFPCDLQGMLGLEVQRNLFLRRHRWMKRGIEITITFLCIPLILPLLIVIALLICLDSPGGPFYQHTRLGYGGKPFKVLKFRTMAKDADKGLEAYFKRHPDLMAEWEGIQKLKHDPRITRVGGVLRRYSLDELPQLWNVLLGEMSLVGPRPIVEDEIEKYCSSYTAFKKVRPGITGLWQVSGRSNVSYDERVSLDEYYVRHWSIWLDMYIILMTFPAVCKKEGAY
jgi:Undecaprenyl-phosphate galactose phosphotransferase WbaP